MEKSTKRRKIKFGMMRGSLPRATTIFDVFCKTHVQNVVIQIFKRTLSLMSYSVDFLQNGNLEDAIKAVHTRDYLDRVCVVTFTYGGLLNLIFLILKMSKSNIEYSSK